MEVTQECSICQSCKKGVRSIMNSFYFLSLINSFDLIRGTKTFGIHSSLFQERNQLTSSVKLLWSLLLFLAKQSQVFALRGKKAIKTKTTKSTNWSNPRSKTLIRNYFLVMLRGYIQIMFKTQIPWHSPSEAPPTGPAFLRGLSHMLAPYFSHR